VLKNLLSDYFLLHFIAFVPYSSEEGDLKKTGQAAQTL
jgi:hypothetical protein